MVVSWWIVPFFPSVSTLPLTLVHGVGQFKILHPKKQNNFQLERSVREIICSTVPKAGGPGLPGIVIEQQQQ